MTVVSIMVMIVISTNNHIESHHIQSKQQVLAFICFQSNYEMECVNGKGEYYGNHCNEYQQSY